MSVQVDDLYCTTGGVQCSQLGSPVDIPRDGNNADLKQRFSCFELDGFWIRVLENENQKEKAGKKKS